MNSQTQNIQTSFSQGSDFVLRILKLLLLLFLVALLSLYSHTNFSTGIVKEGLVSVVLYCSHMYHEEMAENYLTGLSHNQTCFTGEIRGLESKYMPNIHSLLCNTQS